MRMHATPLQDLMVVDSTSSTDHRGRFARWFCAETLAPLLDRRGVVQINQSITHRPGAVRGLHFQHGSDAEMKLVRCVHGRVWDVAVDLRPDSPTFLGWYAEELSADNGRMMVIPEGFAHGFQVLEPDSELLYLMTAPYRPDSATGIRYDDPNLAIAWPLAVTDISDRDLAWPPCDVEALPIGSKCVGANR